MRRILFNELIEGAKKLKEKRIDNEELREIDKNIAELLGYDVSDGFYYRGGDPEEGVPAHKVSRAIQIKPKGSASWFYKNCPYYTVDIKAALELMNEMKELNPFLGFSAHFSREWVYTWYPENSSVPENSISDEPAHAIALGWLKWKTKGE